MSFVIIVLAAFIILSFKDLVKYLKEKKRKYPSVTYLKEKSFSEIMRGNIIYILDTIVLLIFFIILWLSDKQ